MHYNQYFKLGINHLTGNILEKLYLKTGMDFTFPISIKGNINERCNSKCLYCSNWRLDKYQYEMDLDEWKNSLVSLKEFLGWYMIQFSGGEPFLRGDIDLLKI